MTVAEATRLHQACLEEYRRDPDDEFLEREFERTLADMETAWCEHALEK